MDLQFEEDEKTDTPYLLVAYVVTTCLLVSLAVVVKVFRFWIGPSIDVVMNAVSFDPKELDIIPCNGMFSQSTRF